MDELESDIRDYIEEISPMMVYNNQAIYLYMYVYMYIYLSMCMLNMTLLYRVLLIWRNRAY